MRLKKIVREGRKRFKATPYRLLDRLYLPLDHSHLRRTKNIRLIPSAGSRRGGKHAYGEWAHVIGIFQTLLFLHLQQREGNRVLDVGCGTGLMAIASEPFIGGGGKYTGIDVVKDDIAFCRGHYPPSNFEFVHFDVANAVYASDQQDIRAEWPVESASIDLAVALSVWTHLRPEDALFYFGEMARILKPGSRAIVTMFLLDETYRRSLATRTHREGRFHMTLQDQWIFDQSSYGSDMWFHPRWAHTPEMAIAINEEGLELLVATSGLKLVDHHQGNWKEVPGIFFQDVLIFEKA